MKAVSLLLATVLLAATGAGVGARANGATAYDCEIRGELGGVKLGFLYGGQVIAGDGVLLCQARGTANAFETPVHLGVLGGRGLGYDFSGLRGVDVQSVRVGGLSSPAELLGNYQLQVSTGASLREQGISSDSAARGEHLSRAFALELGFRGAGAGPLGARVHGLTFVVEPKR